MAKLLKEGFTIAQCLKMSRDLFKSGKVDDKNRRVKKDIVSAKISAVRNFVYDRKDKTWKTVNTRSVKFEFIVKSRPVSYKKKDRIPTHVYPVTIIMYDIERGLNSTFKYRSGGLKKPLFPPKGCSSEKRLKIEEQNIRNGTDLWFFFNLEWVLSKNNLLFQVNFANRAPKTMNPHEYIYFEKHSMFCITKALIPILSSPQAMSKIRNKLFENEDRPGYKRKI